MMTLNRKNKMLLKAGDALKAGDGVYTIVNVWYGGDKYNRPVSCNFTLRCPDGRTLYGARSSDWYGVELIKAPEAFYTGGGIWISAVWVDDCTYWAVDSEEPDGVAVYDSVVDDYDFACQGFIDWISAEDMNDSQKAIFDRMLSALRETMKKDGASYEI